MKTSTSIATCEQGKYLTKHSLTFVRRSNANTLAVSDRQQIETLRREQKTQHDALASVEDKIQQAERQESKLLGEMERLAERDATVSAKAERKTNSRSQFLIDERERIKSQLDLAAAERSRIM